MATGNTTNAADRALLWSALIGSVGVIAGWVGGDSRTALGIGIGAALAVFSLWSLTFAVPRLADPGQPATRAVSGAVFLFKLAVVAGALWFAMTSPYVQPFAVFAGAAIVPVVIVGLKLKHALCISTEESRAKYVTYQRPSGGASDECDEEQGGSLRKVA